MGFALAPWLGAGRAAPSTRRSQAVVCSAVDRRTAVRVALAVAAGAVGAARVVEPVRADGGEIEVSTLKKGWTEGPTPKTGDLIGVRFKAEFNGRTFDDTFAMESPYYFRLGNGNLVPGLEQAIYLLHVGELARVVVPGELAFGKKGRRPGPGTPSIPPNATITYEVELSVYPGFEPELIEVAGDE
eukprot:CAMPEP_0198332542 /NCGR_PEP_ID=MMETSP1450-20131203/18352_1 /TAXON_ID=753684 ORGANISM="Madagascaria erythrocladiodes, Strain CCMP3234" /NCGR_SAMPLE_ID=MMETSP1450 /ASSEMBLY_ACC=CAM_ASM_001115 /LENGTH=185 /DNA_ID=CAMNT_0044037001 /DNA_START=1 /DNA_END=558 /DNA_ORIENTATION=+